MRYKILGKGGVVVNTIISDRAYMDATYPGRYEEVVVKTKDALDIAEYLDDKARERGYKSLADIISYVDSDVIQYRSDARAVLRWRDVVMLAYEENPSITWGQITALLPDLDWPVVPERMSLSDLLLTRGGVKGVTINRGTS